MGNLYASIRPKKEGPSPYTRSGIPPAKLVVSNEKDQPTHKIWDPMSLQLHMADERIRTQGLTPAEREWRHKFLKDQNLHPDEPVHVDAIHRQMNPIRVLYRWPWDKLYKHFLRPTFGTYYATVIRVTVPKAMWIWLAMTGIYYVWKYEGKNWQRKAGIGTLKIRAYQEVTRDDHDPEVLRLALNNPPAQNYDDLQYHYRMKSWDVGETKRPW